MVLRVNQEWPDIHRDAPYPFKDTASLRSTDGGLQMDQRWIVDARFWPITSGSRVYLRSLERSNTSLSLVLAGPSGILGRSTVDITGSATRAVFFDTRSNQIGYLQSAAGWGFMIDYPEDSYRFGIDATELIPTVVTPQVRGGVSAVFDDVGLFLTGEWRIVGGEGVELVAESGGVRINIIGDELYRRDTCELPAELGLIINPVREIHWQDMNSGNTGIVKPKRGRIVTAVRNPDAEDQRARGHQSPGPNRVLIHQMG